MAIDKKIDYVEQDGSLNFIKNSESVTVPKKFKARKKAPATKLAYITDAEAKMLKKMKKGTPHKGPKGIPSYDSFGSIDASGKDTGRAGSQVSAAERGDFRGFDGSPPVELPPGVRPQGSQEAQNLRSAFIAAGGGQRVNPGFFDSRDVVSPFEIARAKEFNPRAFSKGRNQGLGSFFSSGGILGNLVRGIGQKLGLGKRYNEPTYDMSQFNQYGLGGSQTPNYYNDFDNEFINEVSEIKPIQKPKNEYTQGSIPFNPGMTVGYGTGIVEELIPNSTTNFKDLVIQASGTVGNYAQNAVSQQLYGKDYRVLDPFTQQQIDKLIKDIGTKSTGELASGTDT